MLDRAANAALMPLLKAGARALARTGIGADAVSLIGVTLALAGAVAIASQRYLLGLALIALSRVADGLDGPLARQTQATDRGAFLDITLDFVFYAAVPLAFAFADPVTNALAAATLLATFIASGTTFLAFALIAERRGLKDAAQPHKGLVYLGGLAEATETYIAFALMCVWPMHFATIAFVFAGLCALSAFARLVVGARAFTDRA